MNVAWEAISAFPWNPFASYFLDNFLDSLKVYKPIPFTYTEAINLTVILKD